MPTPYAAHHILLALLGLSLLQAQIPAQSSADPQYPKLELALELGLESVKTGPLAKVQERFIQLLQRGLRENVLDDQVSRLIADQSESCLPLRLQIFACRGSDGMAERDFLVVVDSATPLALGKLQDARDSEALAGAKDAWRNGRTAFRQLSLGGRNSRLVAGNVFGPRPLQSPWFSGQQLPEPPRAKRSLLDRLRRAPYHLMLDLGVLSDDASARRLTALVGRHGLLLGATLQAHKGRPALDLIWGLRPGQGFLGMLLPKKPGDAGVLGSLPFDPSFMLLGNLGREGRRGLIALCRAVLAAGDTPGGLKEVVELLDVWGGEFQFLSRLPDPPLAPLAAIRPPRRAYRDPLFSIVLKVEENSEAESITILKRLIPALVGMSPRFMRFQDKAGMHTTTLGRGRLGIHGADGLVVVALGRTEQDCREVIRGVREQFPVHTTPAKVEDTRAPLKVFVNQHNIARIAHQRPRVPPHIAARGPQHAQAYLFGYRLTTELARQLFTDHVLYSVSWNKSCLRMRLQF